MGSFVRSPKLAELDPRIAKGAESGGKERQIWRPFHPDYYVLRKHMDLCLYGYSAPVNLLSALTAPQGLRLRCPTDLHSTYTSLVIDGTTNMTVSFLRAKVVVVYGQSILSLQRN
jgi:hypothetical protein